MAALARLADTSDGEIGNNKKKSKVSFCLQSQNSLVFYRSVVCYDDNFLRIK